MGPGAFSQPSNDRIDVQGLGISPGGTFDFRVATLKTEGFGGFFVVDVFVIRGTSIESPHRESSVDLKIYDIAGRLVRTLLSDAPRGEGPHVETWDGCDEARRLTASGVYVARLRAGQFIQTRRLVLLK